MSIVAGGNEFMDALKLLGNSAELERRLATYQEAQAKAEETIALAGKASEILALREAAAKEVADLRSMRTNAEAEAAQIVSTAKKQAEDRIREANATIDAQKAEIETAQRKAAEMLATAQARMQEAADFQRSVAAAQKEAENAQALAVEQVAEANAARLVYEDLKRSLETIADQFLTALKNV